MITAQLLLTGVAVGSIYGLVALGFVMIYKSAEVVNFAQGELMMLGALVATTLAGYAHIGYWAALAGAVAIMMVVGGLIDAVIIRRVAGYPQFSIVMLTLGLAFVMRSVASIVWGPETRTVTTPFDTGSFGFGTVSLSSTYWSLIVGTAALCLLMYLAFKYTRIGRAMQAASENQVAAYYMGIPVKRYLSLVWAASAGVSTVAGVLLAPVVLVNVNMGAIGLKAFAAAVVGGFSSIPGALVGGIVVGIAEVCASATMNDAWRNASPYLVLLAVLLIRPQGIFGLTVKKKV